MFRFVLIFMVISTFLPLVAQEVTPLHTFTDKSGQQVTANVLSVSGDLRNMKIRREDGQEFELVINVLSLDDQQFIKEQLDTIPLEKTEYRLEMDVSRKGIDTATHPYKETSYTLTQEYFGYEVKVRNLTRESLENATIEWAVAVDDQLRVRAADEGDTGWTYDRLGDGEPNPVALAGTVAVPSLPFNQEAIVTTEELEVNAMIYDGDEPYREDSVLGAIIRIVGADGTVLLEERLGDASFEEMTWDETIALVAPIAD